MSRGTEYYPNFTNDNLGLFTLDLSIHDHYFIFPIIVFINNYFFLKYTNHPYLYNYIHLKPQKLIYLSFTLSLFSVFWFKCYSISWISYCITHMFIRIISDYINKRRVMKRSYSYHVDKNYKKKILELYKK
jgi:hypothetical protein